MIRSLWTAATGMQGQSTNVDVIANNIANVNTIGFKKSRVDFQDLLYDTLREPGAASSIFYTTPSESRELLPRTLRKCRPVFSWDMVRAWSP
jgi:flagellar basal-body rod protein FlgG